MFLFSSCPIYIYLRDHLLSLYSFYSSFSSFLHLFLFLTCRLHRIALALIVVVIIIFIYIFFFIVVVSLIRKKYYYFPCLFTCARTRWEVFPIVYVVMGGAGTDVFLIRWELLSVCTRTDRYVHERYATMLHIGATVGRE